uniref:Globin family profile domain-containing protein n=1 Tax=Ditylenchus dipsaci TaxID=166011 RepID=A0A915ESW0_9BILA
MFRIRVPRKTSVAAKLERKDSISGRYGTIIPLLPGLTPSQVITIRRSWKTRQHERSARSDSTLFSKAGKNEFFSFQSNCPMSSSSSCNPPPSSNNVRGLMDHTRYFLALLDRIIETDQEVDLELKRVGAKHVILYEQFGMGVPELERLGEIFAEAFFKLDGIRASKETTKAWRILISKLLTTSETGLKQNCADSRRNSMPSSRKTSKLLEIAQITRKLSNF